MNSIRHLASSVERRQIRRGMSTLNFVTGCVLWAIALGLLWRIAVKRSGTESDKPVAATPAPASSETIASPATDPEEPVVIKPGTVKIGFPSRPLPDFEFAECQGGTLKREDLLGKRWLANFVFTRCAGPCPTMTRDVSELHRRVSETAPDFRFVTFTVDPKWDTPEVLKTYSELFRADHERWKFVTGDETAMYDLIRGGFMQYVKPEAVESLVPGFEVAHTNRAVLVNEEGIPVATFLMTVPADVADLRKIIEGRDEFPRPGPPIEITPGSPENPPVSLNLLPAGTDNAKNDSTTAEPEAKD